MEMTSDLKRAICSLFEVHIDEGGVQRIVTPIEYSGSGDQIVVRVRPSKNGRELRIDENGEAAFYAGLSGGDLESEPVKRWVEELQFTSPVEYGDDETLFAMANDERLIAPYVFRVAEAAQQLYTIATSKVDRQASDFKERVKQIVDEIAKETEVAYKSDVELPIAGGLRADHLLGSENPLIIITATSSTRLLEAEVIYMQYRAEKKPGFILAVAESQTAVGKKQFERAAYYTNKAVVFSQFDFGKMIATELSPNLH
jgi:hypothetical protein